MASISVPAHQFTGSKSSLSRSPMRSQMNQITNQTSVTVTPPSGVFSRPLTVVGLLRVLLGVVLLVAAAAKLRAGRSARDALRSYRIESARARAALWVAAIMLEAALGVALAVGARGAAEAAAGLMGLFAVALVAAIASGLTGKPCGCFGGRSKIGWPAVARTALLAAALTALPFLPRAEPSTDAWLATGLVAALLALAALAVFVLALARELGELRLAVAPQAALSLEHEGPELGSRIGLIERFERAAPLAVAVFTSPGCALCTALEPSLRLVASDPEVELELFDEEADAEAWRELAIPGSPYAVVLSADGDVLAKGTFNSLYQLESLLAHATRPVGA
jgi:Methylamine utilisation protein MauE